MSTSESLTRGRKGEAGTHVRRQEEPLTSRPLAQPPPSTPEGDEHPPAQDQTTPGGSEAELGVTPLALPLVLLQPVLASQPLPRTRGRACLPAVAEASDPGTDGAEERSGRAPSPPRRRPQGPGVPPALLPAQDPAGSPGGAGPGCAPARPAGGSSERPRPPRSHPASPQPGWRALPPGSARRAIRGRSRAAGFMSRAPGPGRGLRLPTPAERWVPGRGASPRAAAGRGRAACPAEPGGPRPASPRPHPLGAPEPRGRGGRGCARAGAASPASAGQSGPGSRRPGAPASSPRPPPPPPGRLLSPAPG